MTLPARLRSLAGIAERHVAEAAFHSGRMVITPKLVIDRSKFPAADDEYTPEQRCVIDASLADAEKGPCYALSREHATGEKIGGQFLAAQLRQRIDPSAAID